MKSLILYIPENNFNALKQILQAVNVDGITYFDIMGMGSIEREPSERIVQGYRTKEMFVPEFARRIRVETIVPDTKVKEVIDAIKVDGTIKGKCLYLMFWSLLILNNDWRGYFIKYQCFMFLESFY